MSFVRRFRATARDRALATAHTRGVQGGARERFEGYGVMALPFASGDLLALRRFEASTIGPPYSAVWHRDPAGRWTFYVSVEPARACPRYFGLEIDRVVVTDIDLTWIAHDELVVSAPRARLEWVLRLRGSRIGALLGTTVRLMPGPVWERIAGRHATGTVAGSALGAGRMGFSGVAPNGQRFGIRPRRVWRVAASAALVEGRDLGALGPLPVQARLRDFWLPNAGLFALGYGEFDALDPARHAVRLGGRIERR